MMSSAGVFSGAGMEMQSNSQPAWDEVSAWRQVEERDGTAGFFDGVRSTGIFCRPSCPSRRPAQVNVVYFRHAGEAMAAGFRACLRCQPAGVPAEATLVAAICAHLEANFDRRVTLGELARLVEASPFTVQRMVQRVLRVSPSEYQRALRAAALRRGLGEPAAKSTAKLSGPRPRITDAIYDAGYSSPSRAYEDSRLGMSPGKYRARGEGERIRFTTADCSLGVVLVATTGRGICAIFLGDAPAQLEAELRVRFAQAQRDDADLSSEVAQVLSQMTEHPAAVDLPFDARATAFQTRVWEALRQIPRGETRSYAEVAESLGNPRAVRAVARACASNPVAVLVPCHRVVGSNGKLTGYRWGVERKQRLLDMERGTEFGLEADSK